MKTLRQLGGSNSKVTPRSAAQAAASTASGCHSRENGRSNRPILIGRDSQRPVVVMVTHVVVTVAAKGGQGWEETAMRFTSKTARISWGAKCTEGLVGQRQELEESNTIPTTDITITTNNVQAAEEHCQTEAAPLQAGGRLLGLPLRPIITSSNTDPSRMNTTCTLDITTSNINSNSSSCRNTGVITPQMGNTRPRDSTLRQEQHSIDVAVA